MRKYAILQTETGNVSSNVSENVAGRLSLIHIYLPFGLSDEPSGKQDHAAGLCGGFRFADRRDRGAASELPLRHRAAEPYGMGGPGAAFAAAAGVPRADRAGEMDWGKGQKGQLKTESNRTGKPVLLL